MLPCPHSGAGFYILSVSASYPARAAGQGFILQRVLSFFLSTLQYLRDPMSDDAHTWSQYQVCERALLTWPVWGQRSRSGHRGQKGHFHQKCYFSFRVHRYGHGTHTYWSAGYPLQKLSVWKIYPGSFGVTGVKSSFSPKLLFLIQITWYGHVTHAYYISFTPSTKVIGLKIHRGVTWGHRGQKVIFTKIAISHSRLHGMAMGLMHIDQLDTLYKSNGSRNSPGVTWGHRGQKVIFTKNAISPSDYVVWPWDSCIMIS